MVECQQPIQEPNITRITISGPDEGIVREVLASAKHGCGDDNEAFITVRHKDFVDYSERKEVQCDFPPEPPPGDLCPTYPRYFTYDLIWRGEEMWREIGNRFTHPKLYHEPKEPTKMFTIEGRHDAAWKLEEGYLILIDEPIRGRPADGIVDRVEYITRFDETEGEGSVTYVMDPRIIPAAQALFDQNPLRVAPDYLLTARNDLEELTPYFVSLAMTSALFMAFLIGESQIGERNR